MSLGPEAAVQPASGRGCRDTYHQSVPSCDEQTKINSHHELCHFTATIIWLQSLTPADLGPADTCPSSSLDVWPASVYRRYYFSHYS